MREIRTLGPWLRRFFDEHLVSERNLARNTRASYRDAFRLLLPFVGAKCRKTIDRLGVRDLTSERVLQFLHHIEVDRGCSIQTRNQRLAAIRAFARFVGSRDPAFVEWSGHLRNISSKQAERRRISWLTKQEMEELLDVPGAETFSERNEYALLLFLYNTGARVSEAARLTVGDVQFGSRFGREPLVRLHGKGGKSRDVPLWERTEAALAQLVDGRASSSAVFLSRLGQPFTRNGLWRLVVRRAAKVPALARRRVTPHVLRHTTACALLRSGVDLNTIRAWLGHVSLDTTNIYAEIDIEMKRQAVALCEVDGPDSTRPLRKDGRLMEYLNSL